MKEKSYHFDSICQHCKGKFVYSRAHPYGDHPPKYCPQCREALMPELRRQSWKKSNKYRKDGRYIDKHGYAHIRLMDGKFHAEHRFVMEQSLSRKLRKGESVHHKDGNGLNNAIENLELWVRPHNTHGSRASDLLCPHCGKTYS